MAEHEPAPVGRPSGVVAWVQGLPLAPGICDHAVWAAGRLGTTIELLHLVGGATAEDPAQPDPAFADSVLINPLLDGLPLRRTAIGRPAVPAGPIAGGAQLEVLVLSRRAFGALCRESPLRRLARALVLSPRRLLFC